jgi:hypothetical protein
MIIKPMKIDELRKAVEGQENIIGPAVERHEAYFKFLSCPNCGGKCFPYLDARRPLFTEGSILPNYIAKCQSCDCTFEPQTKLQIDAPSLKP